MTTQPQYFFPHADNSFPPMSPGYPTSQPGTYPPTQPVVLVAPSVSPVHSVQPTNVSPTPEPFVISNQPATQTTPRQWSTDLFACFDNCGICLVGCLSCATNIPFIQCQTSMSAKECFCIGICCPTALRTKIRMQHNIQGSILGDCCTLLWCYYCAMCQMEREMTLIGK